MSNPNPADVQVEKKERYFEPAPQDIDVENFKKSFKAVVRCVNLPTKPFLLKCWMIV